MVTKLKVDDKVVYCGNGSAFNIGSNVNKEGT